MTDKKIPAFLGAGIRISSGYWFIPKRKLSVGNKG